MLEEANDDAATAEEEEETQALPSAIKTISTTSQQSYSIGVFQITFLIVKLLIL